MTHITVTREIIGWHADTPARGRMIQPGTYLLIDTIGDTFVILYHGDTMGVSRLDVMGDEMTYSEEISSEIRGES